MDAWKLWFALGYQLGYHAAHAELLDSALDGLLDASRKLPGGLGFDPNGGTGMYPIDPPEGMTLSEYLDQKDSEEDPG